MRYTSGKLWKRLAEPNGAPDGAAIPVSQGSTSHRPPRQVSFYMDLPDGSTVGQAVLIIVFINRCHVYHGCVSEQYRKTGQTADLYSASCVRFFPRARMTAAHAPLIR